MMGQRSHQPFAFKIRLIYAFVWRQRVFLQSVEDGSRDFLHTAVGHSFKLRSLFVCALVVDTCKFGGNQAQIVVVYIAVSQQLQQPFQRDILLGFTIA